MPGFSLLPYLLLRYLFLGALSTLELLFRLLLSPLGGAALSLTSEELFLLARRVDDSCGGGTGDGDLESYEGDRLGAARRGGGGDALLL
ncbi:hypothetical protein VM1G_11319 [Cytospora mali]|uniref:Uncharacterized protein n=1 Tax=Cytospora mali TaxID=578113 RepID=A0A194VNX0_CYTMA|nr:hypothetical protein VM1G_11319 [Valsa mali]